MGNNCCDKENQSNNGVIFSTKCFMNMKNFNGIDMYFSTESISRLEG